MTITAAQMAQWERDVEHWRAKWREAEVEIERLRGILRNGAGGHNANCPAVVELGKCTCGWQWLRDH